MNFIHVPEGLIQWNQRSLNFPSLDSSFGLSLFSTTPRETTEQVFCPRLLASAKPAKFNNIWSTYLHWTERNQCFFAASGAKPRTTSGQGHVEKCESSPAKTLLSLEFATTNQSFVTWAQHSVNWALLWRLCTAWQKNFCCLGHWKYGHLCDVAWFGLRDFSYMLISFFVETKKREECIRCKTAVCIHGVLPYVYYIYMYIYILYCIFLTYITRKKNIHSRS